MIHSGIQKTISPVDGRVYVERHFPPAAKDAIACLLVEVVGAQDGPSGGNTLSDTTFIQRLNTQGGVAPSQDCASSADVGKQAFVPYTADYFFYKAAD